MGLCVFVRVRAHTPLRVPGLLACVADRLADKYADRQTNKQARNHIDRLTIYHQIINDTQWDINSETRTSAESLIIKERFYKE